MNGCVHRERERERACLDTYADVAVVGSERKREREREKERRWTSDLFTVASFS